MTNPQAPFPTNGPESFRPAQPQPVPSGPHPSGAQDPGPAGGTPQPAGTRGNALMSKPVIGVAALVVGLALGAGAGAAGKPTTVSASPAPTVTVTATVEAPADPAQNPVTEPTDEPTEEATEEAPSPADTSFKYGQKVGFTYEGVEITVKVDAPKSSTNMFDKNNLEAKVTVCNKGGSAIDELSAQGLGLYAEDKSGGQYDLMGAYRTPEFPIYEWDSAKLKAGKCRAGWVSFEDGKKAVRVGTEVSDSTYSWSKSGN